MVFLMLSTNDKCVQLLSAVLYILLTAAICCAVIPLDSDVRENSEDVASNGRHLPERLVQDNAHLSAISFQDNDDIKEDSQDAMSDGSHLSQKSLQDGLSNRSLQENDIKEDSNDVMSDGNHLSQRRLQNNDDINEDSQEAMPIGSHLSKRSVQDKSDLSERSLQDNDDNTEESQDAMSIGSYLSQKSLQDNAGLSEKSLQENDSINENSEDVMSDGNHLSQKSLQEINNIAFEVPDIVVQSETPHGVFQLEGFKSTKNDEIIREKGVPRSRQLLWLSLGYPTFVRKSKNSNQSLFRVSRKGFYAYIQLLTTTQRVLMARTAETQCNAHVKYTQILNMILPKFECSITFEDYEKHKFLVKGLVGNTRKFPLRIDFAAPRGSEERRLFSSSLNRSDDLEFSCVAESHGSKVKTNKLTITSQQSQQIGLETKLFGDGANQRDDVFVTRDQSSQLAQEMYASLNIIEEYDMPEFEFKENFIDGLISQVATTSFKFMPIDTVLASMSRYGFDISKDLEPDVIKRDVGSILKVESRGEKQRIVLDETKVNRNENTNRFEVGRSAKAFGMEASANFAFENSRKNENELRTLNDQVRELNTASKNDVQWEIEGNKVIPKSLNVVQMTRSKFSKTLVFNRVRNVKENALFQRKFVIYTSEAEDVTQHVSDFCVGSPCQNGGTCSSGAKSFSCRCPEQYIGSRCQTKNFCFKNPCQNGGMCSNGERSFSCRCRPQYIGSRCETKDYCASVTCLNGATCSNKANGFSCRCRSGYIGARCETRDFCESNPCQNGGTCSNAKHNYNCRCRPGYTGLRCETKTNYCAGNPCKNGGTCTNTDTYYQCRCQPKFSGPQCNTWCANPRWTRLTFKHRINSRRAWHVKSLEQCKQECRKTLHCEGIDFRSSWGLKCYLSGPWCTSGITFDLTFDHYIMRCV